MDRNPPRRLIVAAGLLLAFVLLSGGLTRFTLAQGLRIVPQYEDRGVSALRFEDRAFRPLGGAAVGWFVSLTLGLGVVIFVIGVLRRESRLSTLVGAAVGIAIGVLLVTIFLTPSARESQAGGESRFEDPGGIMMTEAMDPEDAFTEDAGGRETPWTWTLIVAVPALAGLYLVLRPYLRRPPRARDAEELGRVAYEAARAIEAGADLPDAVQKCYRDMVVALERARSVRRRQSMTPREFTARLEKEGVAVEDVRGLTRLFELSRYGRNGITAEDERLAVEHLRRIGRSLEADRG